MNFITFSNYGKTSTIILTHNFVLYSVKFKKEDKSIRLEIRGSVLVAATSIYIELTSQLILCGSVSIYSEEDRKHSTKPLGARWPRERTARAKHVFSFIAVDQRNESLLSGFPFSGFYSSLSWPRDWNICTYIFFAADQWDGLSFDGFRTLQAEIVTTKWII